MVVCCVVDLLLLAVCLLLIGLLAFVSAVCLVCWGLFGLIGTFGVAVIWFVCSFGGVFLGFLLKGVASMVDLVV